MVSSIGAFTYPTGQGFVRVDCETEKRVYEGGLDHKRSSLDSVQHPFRLGGCVEFVVKGGKRSDGDRIDRGVFNVVSP